MGLRPGKGLSSSDTAGETDTSGLGREEGNFADHNKASFL